MPVNKLQSMKYSLHRYQLNTAIEDQKQRLAATAAKVKRYTIRVEQHRINQMFRNNQRQVYQTLQGNAQSIAQLETNAVNSFWASIWSEPMQHNNNLGWENTITKQCANIQNQANLLISKEQFEDAINNINN